MEKFEIVICGAGIAGALAGYVAARLGRATAIIDCPTPHQPGEGLSGEAAKVLDGLGLGYLLQKADHLPYTGIIHVTGAGRSLNPLPGYIIDRTTFVADLVGAAVAAGCRLIGGKVEAVTRDDARDGLVVRLSDGIETRKIRTAFAVDASGRKAVLARNFAATRHVLTNLAAAWVTLPLTAPAGTLAIEATERHWWYLAAGRHRMAAAVLGRRPPRTLAMWIRTARSTVILRELPSCTTAQMVLWPANVSVVEPVCGPLWTACGDAAATFDPISGYGLTFAIGTGYAAIRVADASLRGDQFAAVAYEDLVADRVRRAWSGLREAYASLAAATRDVA